MKKGLLYSLLAHLFILFILVFEFVSPDTRYMVDEKDIVNIDVVSVTPNPAPQKPKIKQEPKKKPKPPMPKVKLKSKPRPPKKQSPPKPTKKVKPKTPEPKKNPAPIPPKKKEKVKEWDNPDEFEDLLKEIKEKSEKEPELKDPNPDPPSKPPVSKRGLKIPLSFAEKEFIKEQFKKCWNIPAGLIDYNEMLVVLVVALNQDGSLAQVSIADDGRYDSDAQYRAMADSAVRAVRACTPIRNLPPEKYGSWANLELTFDPKELAY